MKGILFTIENQNATREKRKIQTRRLDGLKEINKEPDNWECVERGIFTFIFHHKGERKVIRVKPRYNIGETVYLKEAYYFYRRLGTQANIKYIRDDFVTWVSIPKDKPTPKEGYHSPLFLPEWAARDFIKIKDIGIDRIKNISYSDCLDEGIEPCHVPQIAFQRLWDSINGKRVRSKEYTSSYDWARGGIEHKHFTYHPSPYCWDANPWTWVYHYELLESKS